MLALRILVVLMAFAVQSACVDPDRLLRLLRPLARRSALTATLIARLVPLAAADHVRLGEAAALRGPAAAPVGRAALARRLVAGSLDRAVDVAATLELRGYAHGRAGLGGWRSPLAPRRPASWPRGSAIAVVGARGAGRRGRGVRALSDREHRHRMADAGAGGLRPARCGAPVRDRSAKAGPPDGVTQRRRATRPEDEPWLRRRHWSGSTRSPIATPAVRPSAFARLDLEIAPGELIVLAGRSGSGKTTLLRACCGLVPHYYGGEVAGAIEIAGLDVRHHGPAELGGAVGLVAQDPETQVVSTTVRGELELPLEIRGEPPAARARAVEEVALALAIPQLLDRTADTLSGGELQRVALAAALVGRPRLVLLDEPTSQLDPVAGDELIGLLRRLNEEWGMAVVLAEHRLERCLAAADRVLALVEGRIAFDGAPGPSSSGRWRAIALWRRRRRGCSTWRACARRRSASRRRGRELAGRGVELSAAAGGDAAVPRRSQGARRRRRRRAGARGRDLWVELDAGDGARDVLRGVDLGVAPGERVALMGRNGAGKTTLLRAAAGCSSRSGDGSTRRRVARSCPEPGRPAGSRARRRRASRRGGPAGARRGRARVGGGRRSARPLRRRAPAAGAGDRDGRARGRRRLPGLVCLDEPTRGMDRARKDELGGVDRRDGRARRRRSWSRPTTSSSRPRSPSGWSCSATAS